MGLCSCTPLCCISHTAVLHSNKSKSKISGLHSQLGALLRRHFTGVDLHGRQKAFRESRLVDIKQCMEAVNMHIVI